MDGKGRASKVNTLHLGMPELYLIYTQRENSMTKSTDKSSALQKLWANRRLDPKQPRTVSAIRAAAEVRKLKARQGREDAEEAKAIAKMYGAPCCVSEFGG